MRNSITIDEIHKEIDLIQACIARMANNSFLLKGWFITIYAVVLALLPEKINIIYICVAMFILTLSFWYLDGFFMRTEKIYRKIYDWVLDNRLKNNKELQYQLNPEKYENIISKTESAFSIMFSGILSVFYGFPLFIILIILLFSL